MAPGQDPYAPTRPRRSGLDRDRAPEPEKATCLVCLDLADAGLDVAALPAHEPEQHIGGIEGDVILSVASPPGAITYGDDLDPLRFTREWWAQVIPPGVDVLHVAERRIPLPRSIREGVWLALRRNPVGNGPDDDQAFVTSIEDAWQDHDDDGRGVLEAHAADLEPPEWDEFVQGWQAELDRRAAGSDEDCNPWGMLAGITDADLAEFMDPGPIPDGHVRVSFTRDDVDTDEAGNPMGYGMTGDVPTDAKAALSFLADQPEGAPEDDAQAVQDRARLVLAAEMTRAEGQRRKSVLEAVAQVLPAGEIEERVRRHDHPEQITTEGGQEGGG